MSKAYQCDRCGCYFRTVYSGGVKVDADFCPECVRSFEKWLKMDDKLDGDPIDIDKAIEHYEGTLEVLKSVGLEVNG